MGALGTSTRPAWRAAARAGLTHGAAAGAAILLGLACGASMAPERSSLPPAGTPRDDGSGILARASSPATLSGLLGSSRARGGTGYGGAGYGGHAYGGHAYGGTLYGNYTFDWGAYRRRPLPYPGHGRDYRAMAVRGGGSIRGRVLWPRPPRPPGELAARAPECGGAVPNDTLRVGDRGQVHGAVVYLADIRAGRHGVVSPTFYPQTLQIGGSLTRRRCRFVPHVQVLSPIGAPLRLINDSRATHTWSGAIGGQRLFRLPVPRGVPRAVALARPGFVQVRGPGTPSNAWVVVAEHPYYTVTDRDGGFRIDDVPPGTYTLAVWHEPVARSATDDVPDLTEPFEHRRRITVHPDTTRDVLVELPAAR